MLAAANFKFMLDDGSIYGYFSAAGLQGLVLHDAGVVPPVLLHSAPNRVWGRTLDSLFERYFSGVSVSFTEIPLDLESGTPFQQAVWRETAAIPHGGYVSYGELAGRIGKPGAARAVGTALGANPVCLVVPCHRVLTATGNLGGFSAGLHWKRRFLALEGIPFTERTR